VVDEILEYDHQTTNMRHVAFIILFADERPPELAMFSNCSSETCAYAHAVAQYINFSSARIQG